MATAISVETHNATPKYKKTFVEMFIKLMLLER
jgi:hypothetical protein